MKVFDTDHFSEFIKGHDSEVGRRLGQRLKEADELFGTTIVTYEEQLRGWLEVLHKEPNVIQQKRTYVALRDVLRSFADWDVLDWSESAAGRFIQFRFNGVRIGPMDLKIACLTLEQEATLLTTNFKDFSRVPGLKIEDWLAP